MNPALLQVIAFRTIFQIFLKKCKYNLPTTFLAVCSLNEIIPAHIINAMFCLIEAKRGQIKQTIHLYSYNPNRLAEYLNDISTIRCYISFSKRPMQLVRTRDRIYLFSDTLKSVTGHISPHINCTQNLLSGGITHSIQLNFETLKFENDTYCLNHRHMKEINFYFPKNFDTPALCPDLYVTLRKARNENIQPQPRFSDDDFHVKQVTRSSLFMSYTYRCPSCANTIFDYNCMSQKSVNKSFLRQQSVYELICDCLCCTRATYKPSKFP
jgi:hypothetical protein